jgi:hypothetical protein
MQVMIRCKVRPDGVEADLELLQEVYEEMRSVQPKGLRYATFQLEDKVTFVSFAGTKALRCCSSWRRYPVASCPWPGIRSVTGAQAEQLTQRHRIQPVG